MVIKRILGGLGIAFALLALLMGAMLAWFYLPLDIDLNFTKINMAVLIAMPLLASGYVGGKMGKDGMKYGFITSLILWVLVMALFWWMFPSLMGYKILLGTFIGSVFLGTAGGLCGVNIGNIRRSLKPPVTDEEEEENGTGENMDKKAS